MSFIKAGHRYIETFRYLSDGTAHTFSQFGSFFLKFRCQSRCAHTLKTILKALLRAQGLSCQLNRSFAVGSLGTKVTNARMYMPSCK